MVTLSKEQTAVAKLLRRRLARKIETLKTALRKAEDAEDHAAAQETFGEEVALVSLEEVKARYGL